MLDYVGVIMSVWDIYPGLFMTYIFWDITLASSFLPYLYVCLSSYMGGMRPRFTGRWPAWIASDWSMGAESKNLCFACAYLVNLQRTMENHHVSWVYQLFLWPCPRYVLMLSSLLVFLWPRWENGGTERSDKKSSLRVTLSPNSGGSQALLVNLYCFGVTNMVPSGTQTWQWTFATSNFRLILNFNDFPIEIPKTNPLAMFDYQSINTNIIPEYSRIRFRLGNDHFTIFPY